MIGAGLSLEQSPPLRAALRFFITAPLAGFAIGLTILYFGPELFYSRWSTQTIALVHLLTLGFITMVMFGALMQMLPVLVGALVSAPVATASLVHALFLLGLTAMSYALFGQESRLILPAALLLGLPLAFFAIKLLMALLRIKRGPAAALAMQLSLISFLIGLGCGIALLLLYDGQGAGELRPLLVDLHLIFMIPGWVGLLITGVVMRIIPMFYGAPDYPPWMERYLVRFIFSLNLAWAAIRYLDFSDWNVTWIDYSCGALIALMYASLALRTLYALNRRRRKLPDATLHFWRLGMSALLLALIFYLLTPFWELELLMMALILIGFVLVLIIAMLSKIVPFLVWFHLFSRSLPGVPNMKKILPEKRIKLQFALTLFLVITLLGALIRPDYLARLAGIAFILNSALLLYNIINALTVYLRTLTTTPNNT